MPTVSSHLCCVCVSVCTLKYMHMCRYISMHSYVCLCNELCIFYLFLIGITVSVKTVCLLSMHFLNPKLKRLTTSSVKFLRTSTGIQKVSHSALFHKGF